MIKRMKQVKAYFVSNNKRDAKVALKQAVPSMADSCHINTAHGDIHFNGQQAKALSAFVAVMLSEGTSNPSLDFYNEVLNHTESLSDVAMEYGDRTVMDLFYLHGALHTPDGFIEAIAPSRIVEFVRTLPSADKWMERITVSSDGE